MREGRKKGEKGIKVRNQSCSQKEKGQSQSVWKDECKTLEEVEGECHCRDAKERKENRTEPEQKVGNVGECSTLVRTFQTASAISCELYL